MKPIAIGVLVGTLAILSAWRGDDDPHQQNAALWYWRCFNEINSGKTQVDRYIDLLNGDAQPENDQELNELRETWDEVVDRALQASRKQVCRFGIDREQGMLAILPHLQPMRTLSKMSCARANDAIKAGQLDVAVEQVGFLCRLALHAREDRIMISALVSGAILSMAQGAIESMLENEALSDNQIQLLIKEYERTEAIGIAMLADTIAAERELTSQWMLREWQKDAAATFTFVKDDNEMLEITPEEMLKQIQRMDAQLERIAQAAADADWDRFHALLSDVVDGKHGWVSRLYIPPFETFLETLNKLDQRRANLLEQLRTRLDEP